MLDLCDGAGNGLLVSVDEMDVLIAGASVVHAVKVIAKIVKNKMYFMITPCPSFVCRLQCFA